MTFDTTTTDLHRRLERHRRVDGLLQSRARPVSHKRSEEREAFRMADEDGADIAANVIRDVVSKADEAHLVPIAKRLVAGIFGGSNSNSRSGGNSLADNSGYDSSEGNEGTSAGRQSSSSSATEGGGNVSDDPDSDSSTSSYPSSSSSYEPSSSSSTKNSDSGQSSSSSKSSSSQSSSSDGGLLGGLFGSSSSSTSSSSTALPSTTSSQSSTLLPTSTAIPTSVMPTSTSTSLAYVTSSPTSTAAPTPTQTSSSDDNGPGAGPIIGIVAGSLAGLAIIAVIATFLMKKFGKREDPYENNPFGAQDMYRSSTMPDDFDVNDGYAPSMSEVQKPQEQGYGYQASEYGNMAPSMGHGTQQSFDSGRPRPPTMFQRHLDHQANFAAIGEMGPMPTFVPGMYTSGQPYEGHQDGVPPMPAMAYMSANGYDPNAPHYGYLERSGSGMQHHYNGETATYANLDRGASLNGGSAHGHDANRAPVSAMERQFMPEQQHFDTAGRPGSTEERTGTPDLPNVQQTYATGPQGSSVGHGDGNGSMDHAFASQFPMPPAHESTSTLPAYNAGDHVDDYNQQSEKYRDQQQRLQQHQPLQVRNLLARKPVAPESAEVSHAERRGSSDEAYGGVW